MENTKPLAGSSSEILTLAQPIFEMILAAHHAGDYQQLEPLLSGDMQGALSEDVFAQIILNHMAPLGELCSTEYLGYLQKEDATQALWKARYEDSPVEILWQVFLARRGEGVEVVGLLFS